MLLASLHNPIAHSDTGAFAHDLFAPAARTPPERFVALSFASCVGESIHLVSVPELVH